MSDKTCGTCAHCAKRHGPRDAMANRVCLRMGCLIIDDDDGNCGGLYYVERADSVEQVARDMLRDLERAAAHIDVERWRDGVHTRADRYAERLRALGVVE